MNYWKLFDRIVTILFIIIIIEIITVIVVRADECDYYKNEATKYKMNAKINIAISQKYYDIAKKYEMQYIQCKDLQKNKPSQKYKGYR